jgi:hypothetical protein
LKAGNWNYGEILSEFIQIVLMSVWQWLMVDTFHCLTFIWYSLYNFSWIGSTPETSCMSNISDTVDTVQDSVSITNSFSCHLTTRFQWHSSFVASNKSGYTRNEHDTYNLDRTNYTVQFGHNTASPGCAARSLYGQSWLRSTVTRRPVLVAQHGH